MKRISDRISELKKEGHVECTYCFGYGSIKVVRLSFSEYRTCTKCKGRGFIYWVDDLKGECNER